MEQPVHLRYTLNRWQRLVPHLRLWHGLGPPLVAVVTICLVAAFQRNAWFLLAALVAAWLARGYIVGFADLLLKPTREMDLLIEPLGIGVLIGAERWYVHMDGIASIQQFTQGVWTIAHRNGTVFHVPTECMPDVCVQHIRAAIQGKWAYLQQFAVKHREHCAATSEGGAT
jgi:hypothetical protein